MVDIGIVPSVAHQIVGIIENALLVDVMVGKG